MVSELLGIDLVCRNDAKRAMGRPRLPLDEREVVLDEDRAELKSHVVIGAEAEYVARDVGSVVRPTEWANLLQSTLTDSNRRPPHSIAGRAIAGGSRPARSQPAAVAVRGTPTTVTIR